jgi:hypothetical protein
VGSILACVGGVRWRPPKVPRIDNGPEVVSEALQGVNCIPPGEMSTVLHKFNVEAGCHLSRTRG